MNNDKRIFALLSLGLFLIALLAPFFIAAQGSEELAVGFGIVAGFLALLFGALSWSDCIGRTVAIASLSILIAGVVILPTIRALRMRQSRPEPATASVERRQTEAAPPK